MNVCDIKVKSFSEKRETKAKETKKMKFKSKLKDRINNYLNIKIKDYSGRFVKN